MTEKVRGIPSWPISDEKEEMAMKEVLDSGSWWRNGGIQTKEFEKEFAAYQGAAYGITAANGTQALEIALKALASSAMEVNLLISFSFFCSRFRLRYIWILESSRAKIMMTEMYKLV